jgi:hypothetical protein
MSVSSLNQGIINKIKKLPEDEKQLLVEMLKELKGNIDESLKLEFIAKHRFMGIGSINDRGFETTEVLKKIGPSEKFYTIKDYSPPGSAMLYYPFFTLEQINVILKGLDDKITQDIITNLTQDLYTNGNIVSLTYNKSIKEITVKETKPANYAAASSSQQKPPPPPPPRPPPPPSSYDVLFPAGLQILRIQRGHNRETNEILPEEFFVGFPTQDKFKSLKELSRDLRINAHIISSKATIDKDGVEHWNKTVHTKNPEIGYFIILTIPNIKSIIDNFEILKVKFGGQILTFLNKIYEAMKVYKTITTTLTKEFEKFFVELKEFIDFETAIENSLRYKYLKYKMKYLELKNKNKL